MTATPREREIAAQMRERTGPGMTSERQRGLMETGRASLERSQDRASRERISENQAQIMSGKNDGVVQVPEYNSEGKRIGTKLVDKKSGADVAQGGQEVAQHPGIAPLEAKIAELYAAKANNQKKTGTTFGLGGTDIDTQLKSLEAELDRLRIKPAGGERKNPEVA